MKKYKALAFFILKVVGIYVLWVIAYESFLAHDYIDSLLTKSEAFIVTKLFTLFGYASTTYEFVPPDSAQLYWGERKLINIADNCNGLILFVVFIAFIISFPSELKHRLTFIPTGLVAIYFLNIVRIFALAIIYIYFPTYLDFNHHYTFKFFVYMDIFLLWMFFVKKYGKHQDLIPE